MPEPEPVIHHGRQDSTYGIVDDLVLYPVSHQQLRRLLGGILTHLDAMSLTDRAHSAARTLLTQEVWRWWDTVYRNATTSYQGCVAPIVMTGDVVDENRPPSNRWGHESEQAWLASTT
jgi:hypothetical protein